jgi:hypothetical protein
MGVVQMVSQAGDTAGLTRRMHPNLEAWLPAVRETRQAVGVHVPEGSDQVSRQLIGIGSHTGSMKQAARDTRRLESKASALAPA